MLLGRSTERRQVQELLDGARAGASRALVVIGEPGIGKTALLDFAVAGAHGILVLRARGTESEAALPFAGLADLVRPITRHIGDIPAPQSAALAGALGLGPHTPSDPFTTFLSTFSLLAAEAERQPVLVAVDDAHWLDPSSRDAILFAARRLHAEGIAMMLAIRPESAGPFAVASLPTMTLGGLERPDGQRLLRQAAGDGIHDDVATSLVIAANGNPLALKQLPRLLSPAQLNGHEELPDPLPIGADLRQLFLRRLAQLPADTRRALLLASASASGDMSEIAAALRNMGLDVSQLEPAEEAGIITIAPELQFTHPLVRAAIYHDAPPPARRQVHRGWARVVTGGDAAARRAWHLAAATIGTDEAVASAVEAAAQDARARGAHAVAATAYERAAALSAAQPSRLARQMAAAGEHVLAGQASRALPLLDDARERTMDEVMRAEIDHFRGRVLMIIGPLARAHEVLADGAHVIQATAAAKAASMLSDAALACFISGQLAIGETLSRQALALTGNRDDEPGEINHILFAGLLVLRGKAREAEEHIERERRRIQAMQPVEEWQLIPLSAIWLMWAEELDLAGTVLDRAIAQARRMAAVGLLPLPLAQRAELAWRMGDWTAAYATSAEAVRLAAETGQAVTLSYALAIQTLVLAGLGREPECRASAAAALDAARPVGAESTISRVEAALGLLELGSGRTAHAARHLRNAHEALQSQGVGEPTVVPYVGDLIEALLRADRASEAMDVIEQVEASADGDARRWTRGVLARARGMAAPDNGYVRHFQEALEWQSRMTARFDQARTLLAFGERLRRSGQRLLARDRLREALHEFERLGAISFASRTRAELRAAGEPASDSSESALGGLTPQELQIALAVAGGLTNREVAASLFLSPKTIEFHLGNVYAKLALRSRTELARMIASGA
jgi:DNA-binding CsgD family transcriptional regulator